jgi:hypothetical protein
MDTAAASGATPFVLIIPERWERYHGRKFEDIDRLALEEARALGLPTRSLSVPFHAIPDAERERPLFREDGHLSEAGNCEMARLLGESLAEHGIAPDATERAARLRCQES